VSLPSRRAAAAAIALVIALPAAAYLPPASAILKRVAQRRDELHLTALEARGTVAFAGESAQRVAAAMGAAAPAGELTLPAVLTLKSPGRCRLELAPESATPADRPAVSLRAGRVLGHRGLEGVTAARALVEGVCALLAERTGAEAERALAQGLSARGVALSDVALGRVGGRVAWVLGGRPQEARPQAWIDKQSFQPVRLVAPLGGPTRDVRLVDFGSPVAGDAFPRAVEVWNGGALEARFTVEKLWQNPRLPDALF
jgi:hypothetical protein